MFMLMFVVFMVIQTHIIHKDLKRMKENKQKAFLYYAMHALLIFIWLFYIFVIVYVLITHN